VGLVLGWPAAVLAARLLRSLLFEVRPGDPLVSALVAAVLLLACLLASWVPARRAAAIDPAVVLRGE
jgi:ABC-type lipoprotein release transport system permease subunit